MQVFRGFRDRHRAPCALTIGNFDGVHRGHQAMLALLVRGAAPRPAGCVMTFEPHPRDYFASPSRLRPRASPRCATSSPSCERCGVDQAVVLRFDGRSQR